MTCRPASSDVLARVREQAADMVDDLRELVAAESPTSDVDLCRRAASVVEEQARRLGLASSVVERGGRPHVLVGDVALERWEAGPAAGQVLLVGHLDTVWEKGAFADAVFDIREGVAVGPGVYDMKAGIVQGLHALATAFSAGCRVDGRGPGMLVTSDEETGSLTSRGLLEELARRADAVLVLEPGPPGGVKIARKGFAEWELQVFGRAAHAGLEPERGINAAVELARQVIAVSSLDDGPTGTTVTPTVVQAGRASNVVPETACLTIDARSWDETSLARVERALRSLRPHSGATLRLRLVSSRPPLGERAGTALWERACEVAGALGVEPLTAHRVGGVSDGNFAAAVGAPTLDGLGAVGGGAHARSEHVIVAEMPTRAALVCGLLLGLAERPVGSKLRGARDG